MVRKKDSTEREVNDLLDSLLEGRSPEEVMGGGGLLEALTKRVVERALEGELTDHLGYEKHAREGRNRGNSRNGRTRKRVKTDTSEFEIEVLRDRDSTFDPKFVRKGQRRLPGFDEKVIALYARGMTTREIRGHLKELYKVEVSPAVTDAVLEDVKAWQGRPLDTVYPIVYLDAIHVKVRSRGHVRTHAVYLALALTLDGNKELLGLWVGEGKGAKFWLSVLTELKNRGVEDILIAAIDGLKGFPEAIESVFPKTRVQFCIVHLVRGSLRFVAWKERKAVARDLRTIYRAPSSEPGGGRDGAGGLLGALGRALPHDQPEVAGELGKPDPVLPLSARDPQGHVHDERDRGPERAAHEGDEEARRVPNPGGGQESAVPCDREGVTALDPARSGLDRRPEPPVDRG